MTCASARTAVVEVPYTCGELVQGYMDGEPFLVSCPIARYARVEVALEADLFPPALPKATAAVAATLRALGYGEQSFSIQVTGCLPPSRGFGTSTADVVGAIVATSKVAGTPVAAMDVARIATSIEPSDGTMFPGLTAFNHRSGKRAVHLGPVPPLLVAVLEFDGAVDTLDFNARLNMEYLRSLEGEYARTLSLLSTGLRDDRLDTVGAAATSSARLNQAILPKPQLEEVISLAGEHDAVGVCAAHSGTVLGVLFRPEARRQADALASLAPRCLAELERAWLTQTINGGAKILGLSPRNDWSGRVEDRWVSSR